MDPRQLAEAIREALRDAMRGGGGLGALGGGSRRGGGGGGGNVQQELIEEQKDFANQLKNSSENIQRMNKSGILPTAENLRKAKEAQGQFNSDLNRARQRLEEIDAVLQAEKEGRVQLNDATKASLNNEKTMMSAAKKQLEFESNKQQARDAIHAGATRMIQFMGEHAHAAAAAAQEMASAVMAGGSGFNLFGAAANYAAEQAYINASAGAKTTQTLGDSMIQMGGKAAIAGTLVSMLGQAAQLAAELQKKATMLQNQIFMQQGEAISKSFMTAAGSGAIFAKGADGMAASIKDSRLLLNDLGEVIKNNAESLAAAGLGMEESVKQIGRVGSAMKKSGVDQTLLQLGYSFKDQADIMATVMADMRKRDPGAAISDATIAQRTKEYAQNLTAISALTGEDAKKKMEEAKKLSNNLGFQQKLFQMGEANAQKITDAQGHMSAQMNKDFQDMLMRGKITNQAGARLASVSPAYQAMQSEMARLAKEGKLNGESMQKLNAQYGPIIRQQMMAAQGLGNAAHATDGVAREIGQSAVEVLDHQRGYTKKAVEAVNAATGEAEKRGEKGEKDPNAPLTNAITNAANTMNDFQKDLEKYVIKNLPKFADAMNAHLAQMRNAYMGVVEPVPGMGKLGEFFAKYGQYIMMAMMAFQTLVPILGLFKGKATMAATAMDALTGGGKKSGQPRDPKTGRFVKAPPSRLAGVGKFLASNAGKLTAGAGILSAGLSVASAVGDYSDISDRQARGEITEKQANVEKGGAVGSGLAGAGGALAGAKLGAMIGTFIMPGVGTAIGGMLGSAVGAFAGSSLGESLGETIVEGWQGVKEWSKSAMTTVGAAFTTAGTWVGTKMTEAGNAAKAAASSAMDMAKSTISGATEFAKGVGQTAMGMIGSAVDAAKTTFPGLTAALGGMLTGFDKTASSVINKVMTSGSELFNKASGAFDSAKTMLSGLFDSIGEKLSAAKNWASEKISSAKSFLGFGGDNKPAGTTTATPTKPDTKTTYTVNGKPVSKEEWEAQRKGMANMKPADMLSGKSGIGTTAQSKPAEAPKPATTPPPAPPAAKKDTGPLPSQKAGGDPVKLQAAMADALERIARNSQQHLAVSESILRHTR